jgi:pyruvate dehydrogenase E1 component alpha subunit
MHMYRAQSNFHGGNGIVGAHVPVGAGVAWAQKLLGKNTLCVAAYGDGAANQGQVFETFNMAALWKIPVVFVIENNHFAMGTADHRSAGSVEYFRRGDFLPGIKVDGMDVFTVKRAMQYCAEMARSGNPILLEVDTYRYAGHSMSDPGTSYRTRDDVKKVRETRDPITLLKNKIIDNKIATEEELAAIDKDIKIEVDEAVEFAKKSEFPPLSETYTHVFQEPIAVRATELSNTYVPN